MQPGTCFIELMEWRPLCGSRSASSEVVQRSPWNPCPARHSPSCPSSRISRDGLGPGPRSEETCAECIDASAVSRRASPALCCLCAPAATFPRLIAVMEGARRLRFWAVLVSSSYRAGDAEIRVMESTKREGGTRTEVGLHSRCHRQLAYLYQGAPAHLSLFRFAGRC